MPGSSLCRGMQGLKADGGWELFRFASQQLPKKLPPPPEKMPAYDVNKLPMLGYLEQTVVDVLTAVWTLWQHTHPQ